ncbi:transglycosylase SLT domain-containing protein [Gluconobacter cerinus]|uniref:transglycosylase SLT domain-containing protein n=1 Tax=Gluconobacter cerinus TaxID=38307 RepID=UPI002012D441|nr:transglycosylase SLT domain-containing protein [Gluconobacter cerinus]
MRRITPFISGGTARALLVSVLILTGGTFSPVRADGVQTLPPQPDHAGDETAFAEARPSLGGDGIVSLPHPLTATMASRYRLILQAQRRGDLQEAMEQTRLLTDRVLLGDVLADRYLAPGAHPGADQLRDWLKNYSTQPDAPAIQGLLVRTAPAGSVQVQTFVRSLAPEDRPETVHLPNSSPADPLAHAFTRNPLLDRTIQERVMQGVKGAASALHLVDITPGMTPAYAGQLYGEISLGLLSQGDAQSALRHGCAGFERGGHQVGLPAYVAGLAAWRQGHLDAAYELFESAANAPVTSPELHAAAAFWAARAEIRRHAMAAYVSWLHRAANHHETFYGMLAAQTLELGRKGHARLPDSVTEITLHDPVPVLGEIDVEAISALPQGRQLFALLQIGERARAEALMRRMWTDVAPDSARSRSLQLVAQTAGFEDLSEQLASLIMNGESRPQAAGADLPMPRLKPNHGFRMNPALVYALTRVESNFDAAATSGAGAHGLMQIRPITASFITLHHQTYDAHGMAVIPVPPDMVNRLHNPSSNLEIGQLYVLYLASQSSHTSLSARPEGGDLVRVLASYNAGPGAIARWERAQTADLHDPLFFMETLPNTETRDYVHRALTYTWLYAHKMGLSSPSLKALTHSEWPSFGAEQALAHEQMALN